MALEFKLGFMAMAVFWIVYGLYVVMSPEKAIGSMAGLRRWFGFESQSARFVQFQGYVAIVAGTLLLIYCLLLLVLF